MLYYDRIVKRPIIATFQFGVTLSALLGWILAVITLAQYFSQSIPTSTYFFWMLASFAILVLIGLWTALLVDTKLLTLTPAIGCWMAPFLWPGVAFFILGGAIVTLPLMVAYYFLVVPRVYSKYQ